MKNLILSIFNVLRRKKITRKHIMRHNTNYINYSIGRMTYGNPLVRFANSDKNLQIGNFCSIANDVQIFLGGEHRIDWLTTYPFMLFYEELNYLEGHPKSKGDVIIGNDVWIGDGAVILSGVKIGNGVVIGARSVVSKDIPDYAIVVGNPATIIKYRFDTVTIEKLQQISWWNWSDEHIKNAGILLCSQDIDKLYSYAKDNNLLEIT